MISDINPSRARIFLSLVMDSSVSLNTMIRSQGCFFIMFIVAHSLLSAELNKAFLFLTFLNHAFAIPLTKPPVFSNEEIDGASQVFRHLDMFLILVEQLLYNLRSSSVNVTSRGMIIGGPSL